MQPLGGFDNPPNPSGRSNDDPSLQDPRYDSPDSEDSEPSSRSTRNSLPLSLPVRPSPTTKYPITYSFLTKAQYHHQHRPAEGPPFECWSFQMPLDPLALPTMFAIRATYKLLMNGNPDGGVEWRKWARWLPDRRHGAVMRNVRVTGGVPRHLCCISGNAAGTAFGTCDACDPPRRCSPRKLYRGRGGDPIGRGDRDRRPPQVQDDGLRSQEAMVQPRLGDSQAPCEQVSQEVTAGSQQAMTSSQQLTTSSQQLTTTSASTNISSEPTEDRSTWSEKKLGKQPMR